MANKNMTGLTQQITTISNGVIRYEYGKNILYVKQCDHPDFGNYMQLLKTVNSNSKVRQGNCVRNFRLMLSDVKGKGFKGVVIFEKNKDGFINLSNTGRAIIESRILKGIMTKKSVNGENIYLYVNAPIN